MRLILRLTLRLTLRSPSPLNPNDRCRRLAQRATYTCSGLLALLLSGCVSGGRLLELPFDPGGRSLNSPYSDTHPAVSGRYVVSLSDRRGSQDLLLYDLQARTLIPIPGLNQWDVLIEDASVSEDGRWILFCALREGRSRLYLYSRDAQQSRELFPNWRASFRHPSLDARGQRLAFEVNVNGQWDIAVYDRNGQPLPIPTNPRN